MMDMGLYSLWYRQSVGLGQPREVFQLLQETSEAPPSQDQFREFVATLRANGEVDEIAASEMLNE